MDDDDPHALLRGHGLTLAERRAADGVVVYCVSGETHPYRNVLRRAGGRWNALERYWEFTSGDPSDALREALLSQTAPAGAFGEVGRPYAAKSKPHYHGHRQRLRERFLSGPDGALPDYELLELLLFFSIPRVDVKPLAKSLIERFGSFAAALAAPREQLADFEGVNQQTLVLFRALRDTAARLAKARVLDGPLIDSPEALIDYCRTVMADTAIEEFRLLFLDRKSRLIADEVQQRGTVDHTPVYVREVVKRALDLGACGIILVHNHPSGDPGPSDGDVAMTRRICDAAGRLGIAVEDHLIIAKSGHVSLRAEGLF